VKLRPRVVLPGVRMGGFLFYSDWVSSFHPSPGMGFVSRLCRNDGPRTKSRYLCERVKVRESWFTFPGTKIFPFVFSEQLKPNLRGKGLGKDWLFTLYDEEDKEEELTKDLGTCMSMFHALFEDVLSNMSCLAHCLQPRIQETPKIMMRSKSCLFYRDKAPK
jgi:hypothetical protein